MHIEMLRLLPLGLLISIVEAVNYDVTVGKDTQLKFVPDSITAGVGDTVTYHFFSKNHSVVQSSFDDPCHPLAGGFFSGFTPTASSSDESATTWTVAVNSTKPIWVYCSQGNHCQSGMVGAINAPTSGDKTLDAFKSKASSASASTSPPDGLPVGGNRITHVDVGANGLAFTPNNITELPGTIIQFSFRSANHSVVQSSFDDPCHPLPNGGGFSSGFVPFAQTGPGVLFDIVVPDTKPIWFYCAQTTKSHCQSGMVGSINAPTTGNTIDAFTLKAKGASESTIPPNAPLLGVLSVNGTIITDDNGDVLNATALDTSAIGFIPAAGGNVSSVVSGMAGGGPPQNYNWGQTISGNGTSFLQLLQFLDNILLEILVDGYGRLSGSGSWAHLYPEPIVATMGSMAAQALVHRSTASDSLQHYGKPMPQLCTYKLPSAASTASVDDYLHGALTVLLLEIGLLLDVVTLVAASDPWMVPALATQVGAKSRMAAVVNMMQSHAPAAAPREAMIPASLAYSYAMQHYVASCPGSSGGGGNSTDLDAAFGKPLPPLAVNTTQTAAMGRAVTVKVDLSGKNGGGGDRYLAWIGPWGGLRYTQVASDGSASVPHDVYGHVWAVLVSKQGGKLQELPGVAVAGPEMVWVSGEAL